MMPQWGNLPPGPTRPFDRLNPNAYGAEGGGFIAPDDAMWLLDLFSQALPTQPVTTERFLAAAKAYETSYSISRATATGSMASQPHQRRQCVSRCSHIEQPQPGRKLNRPASRASRYSRTTLNRRARW